MWYKHLFCFQLLLVFSLVCVNNEQLFHYWLFMVFLLLLSNKKTYYYCWQAPYEVSVAEDTPIGSTVFSDIVVEDADLSGETLDVSCMEHSQVALLKTARGISIVQFSSLWYSLILYYWVPQGIFWYTHIFYLLWNGSNIVICTTTVLSVFSTESFGLPSKCW